MMGEVEVEIRGKDNFYKWVICTDRRQVTRNGVIVANVPEDLPELENQWEQLIDVAVQGIKYDIMRLALADEG